MSRTGKNGSVLYCMLGIGLCLLLNPSKNHNGTAATICRAEVEMQMKRMYLWTQQGEREDKLKE